ncbi:MAG: hypothetical protein OXI83_05490 [Gemmatimonadota bacterium]|nr:hypothetical protein [Gemmatimonadota bacterium]
MRVRPGPCAAFGAILLAAAPSVAQAQTEMHFQYGSITNPFAETSTGTLVLTIQHASFRRFGDNFFFIDLMEDGVGDGFNDKDAYGEWYSNLSLRKLGGRDLGFGPFSDFGIFAGVAFGADANVLQWLPGARIAWNLPGFIFLNTDFMMAVDGTDGLDGGSPPERDSRTVIDINGLLPFSLGSQSFSITGDVDSAVPSTPRPRPTNWATTCRHRSSPSPSSAGISVPRTDCSSGSSTSTGATSWGRRWTRASCSCSWWCSSRIRSR